jgi:phosphatidylinositol-3,4,5-trisphosphate 3-phosphatase and dual-specificity protein phosphatase PTEN
MGYPAENFEAWYRNPISEVRRFLNRRHGNRYKIYNLCSERKYDTTTFDKGEVCEKFGFDDHNPPPFDFLYNYCVDAHEWLEQHEGNIIAVHCKAGKGRTGVMICCYLVFAYHCAKLEQEIESSGIAGLPKRKKKDVTNLRKKRRTL